MIPVVKSCTYLLNYSMAQSAFEKLTGLQLVKKLPAFHGTRRFINALRSVRNLFLSWASPIQSIYTHPTSWRSVIILSVHLRLGPPSGLLPSGFPTKTLYTPSPHPYVPHAQPISFFSISSPAQYWVRSIDHLAHMLLAIGDNYSTVCNSFQEGFRTVSETVRDVCETVWKKLQSTYIPAPIRGNMRRIGFAELHW